MMRLLALLALALAQRPPVEEAWDLLAKGARQEAVRVLSRIITANPRDGDARLLLGSILSEEGRHAEAVAHLGEAVRLLPRSAEAYNALGEASSGAGDAKAARAAFEKAIELDPAFAPARVNLAPLLLQAGEFDRALPHLDRALAILGETPDAAYPHYLRAKVYTQQNAMEKPAAELARAVALRPDFAEAWSDLGQARKTLLDDAGALAAFRRAVETGPDNSVAQYRLGAEYLRQGQARLAIPHLERAMQLDPANQSTLNSLQLALRQEGHVERAAEIRKKLTELLRARDQARQNALAAVELNNQGAALEKVGNLRAAAERYRAALALDPEHNGIRVNLAMALLRLGQWTPGLAELREAVRRDPHNPVLKQALADAVAQAPAK